MLGRGDEEALVPGGGVEGTAAVVVGVAGTVDGERTIASEAIVVLILVLVLVEVVVAKEEGALLVTAAVEVLEVEITVVVAEVLK